MPPVLYGVDPSPIVKQVEAALGATLSWKFDYDALTRVMYIGATDCQGYSAVVSISADALCSSNMPSRQAVLTTIGHQLIGNFRKLPYYNTQLTRGTVMPNIDLRTQCSEAAVEVIQDRRVQVADFVSYNRDDGRFYKTSIVTYLDEEVDEHGNPIDELPF